LSQVLYSRVVSTENYTQDRREVLNGYKNKNKEKCCGF
jgi:hypothetical protein